MSNQQTESLRYEKSREAVFSILNEATPSMNPDDFSDLYDLLKRYYPGQVSDWDSQNRENTAHEKAILSLRFILESSDDYNWRTMALARIAFHENAKN